MRIAASFRKASRLAAAVVWPFGLLLLCLLAVFEMRLGSKLVGWADVLAFPGRPTTLAQAILETSRTPRLVAAILTGAAPAMAGAVFQTVLRNPLAAPDILSVTSGAHLALVISTLVLPLALPAIVATGAGGMFGAVACIALAGGFSAPPGRLALAGVAISLCFSAIASAVVLLADDRASGLILWSSGILDQTDWGKVMVAAPVMLIAAMTLTSIARPLDLLNLGQQTSAGLGVTRTVILSGLFAGVILSGAAVTLAGPIGFVGLAVPNCLRAIGIIRHRSLLALSAIWGANTLLLADVVVQFVAGTGVVVPTGVAVACLGAPAMLLLLKTSKIGAERRIDTPSPARRPATPVLVGVLVTIGLATIVGAIVIGDGISWTLADVASNLDLRAPRLMISIGCGALLAAAGTVLQATTRNPLCGPETLGMVQGAGFFSLLAILSGLPPGTPLFQTVTLVGAFAAVVLLLVFGPSRSPEKLVLAGVAIAASFGAAATIVVVEARLQTAQALAWLTGSTHGRGYGDVLVMLPWLGGLSVMGILSARHLDAFSLGDEKARTLGLPITRARVLAMIYAAFAVAIAVSSIGAIGFVGLLAPHAARLVAGPRHARNMPVSMIIGALLTALADLVGRSVVAPLELPAGIVTAVIGAPLIMFLLRSKSSSRQH